MDTAGPARSPSQPTDHGEGTDRVAEDPGAAALDLIGPSLLAGLAADPDTADSAGRAIALIGRVAPGAVDGLAERLAVELVTEVRRPLLRALATLAVDHDATVREALLDATGTTAAKRHYERVQAAEPWQPPSADRADAFSTAFRQLIRPADGADTTTERPTVRERPATEGRDDAAPVDPVRRRAARLERVRESEVFRDIAARSSFDDLQVVEPPTDRRFGSTLRVRARANDEEYGVAVRLLEMPDADGFRDHVGDHLDGWSRIRADGVVTVADHGVWPRPWAATEYVEARLTDRGRLDPRAVLTHARELTGALATLHQHDVVHGGIDPASVGYTASLDTPRPMLDDVGLLTVYRRTTNPADYLDPRFAAPEYFDADFGQLDHATDIYQLGMVLYRAATGHPPFEGTHEDIRVQVCEDHPPAPSGVAPGLPEVFDELLAKATAKQKLTRYETAERFHRDACRVREAVS